MLDPALCHPLLAFLDIAKGFIPTPYNDLDLY